MDTTYNSAWCWSEDAEGGGTWTLPQFKFTKTLSVKFYPDRGQWNLSYPRLEDEESARRSLWFTPSAPDLPECGFGEASEASKSFAAETAP